MVDPLVCWTAEDLRDVSTELGEAWRVDAICKKCVEGRMPRKVVDEFSRAAAFPAASKRSLSNSLPGTIAKAFNALKVPVGLKSVITAVTALTYVILRDIQLHTKLDKIISDEVQRPAPSPGPAMPPAPQPPNA